MAVSISEKTTIGCHSLIDCFRFSKCEEHDSRGKITVSREKSEKTCSSRNFFFARDLSSLPTQSDQVRPNIQNKISENFQYQQQISRQKIAEVSDKLDA